MVCHFGQRGFHFAGPPPSTTSVDGAYRKLNLNDLDYSGEHLGYSIQLRVSSGSALEKSNLRLVGFATREGEIFNTNRTLKRIDLVVELA